LNLNEREADITLKDVEKGNLNVFSEDHRQSSRTSRIHDNEVDYPLKVG
jgi:hypothetical protein